MSDRGNTAGASGADARGIDEFDRFMGDDDGEDAPPAVIGDNGTEPVDDPLDAWMSGEAEPPAEGTQPGRADMAHPGNDPLDEWMSGDASGEDADPRENSANGSIADPLDEWMSGNPAAEAGDEEILSQRAPAPEDDPLDAWMSGEASESPDASAQGSPTGAARVGTPDSDADGFEDYVPEPRNPTDAASDSDRFENYVPDTQMKQDGPGPAAPNGAGTPPPMPATASPVPISEKRLSDRPYGMVSVLVGCVGLAVAMIAVPRTVAIALAALAAVGIGFGIAGIRTQDRMMAAVGILMGIALVAWRVASLVVVV